MRKNYYGCEIFFNYNNDDVWVEKKYERGEACKEGKGFVLGEEERSEGGRLGDEEGGEYWGGGGEKGEEGERN